MKKVTNVTLGGVVFAIEEDAYTALGAYLDAVARHFAAYPEKDEIVEDIEGRMAEKFAESLTSRKRTVSRADVDAAIGAMGTVEDFASALPDEQGTAAIAPASPVRKRLYRDPEDAILGGVGSGIAAYFGADPTLIRLTLFIIVFFGGFGALLYAVLWLIVPAADTETERLEMRGEPVTLAALEASLKDRVADVRERKDGWFRRLLSFPVLILRALFGFLARVIPVLLRIIGLFILLGAIAMTVALSAGMLTALTTPGTLFDVDLTGVFTGPAFTVLVVAVYFALFLPVLAGILAGASLLKRRNLFSGAVTTTLVVLWVAAVSVVAAVAPPFVPQVREAAAAVAARETETRTIDGAEQADRIESQGSTHLTVVRADVFRVTATGRASDLDRLSLRTERGILRIGRNERFCLFCFSNPVRVTIETPDVDALLLRGGGGLRLDGIRGDALDITTHGSGDIEGSVTLDRLRITSNGSSDIKLSGTAAVLDARVYGSSDIDATGLVARTAALRIATSSDIDLRAEESLDVAIYGSGDVRYLGDPRVTKALHGSGEVIRLDSGQPAV